MSRKEFCEEYEGDARRVVYRTIKWFREAGHKNDHAITQAAIALGITPRRAWSLRYPSNLVRVAREQRDLMLHRAWSHMDRQAADLRERADQIERMAEAERIAAAQLILPFGEGPCSERSARGSSSADGDGRSPEATARKQRGSISGTRS